MGTARALGHVGVQRPQLRGCERLGSLIPKESKYPSCTPPKSAIKPDYFGFSNAVQSQDIEEPGKKLLVFVLVADLFYGSLHNGRP